MLCQKCGKEIDNDSEFCSYCGHEVDALEIPEEFKTTNNFRYILKMLLVIIAASIGMVLIVFLIIRIMFLF